MAGRKTTRQIPEVGEDAAPHIHNPPRYTARVLLLVDRLRPALALLFFLAPMGAGCAAKQTIPLDCVPKDLTIFVDKKPLEEVPDSIELRVDRPHTLFFRGEGYEPAMLILESVEGEQGPALAPGDVCVELHFVERTRNVEIEIER